MTEVNFVTYNVRGLNSPTKTHKILKELQQYRADVVFLQETHVALETNIKIYSTNHPTWFYGDSPIKRSKGAAIGFAKTCLFSLTDRMTDLEG